jgi:hypothetical protein
MPLPKLTLTWRIALAIVGLVVVALCADYFWRCSGIPLSRKEALRRATTQLEHLNRNHAFGDSLPALVDEQYDSNQQTWMFTFRNGACTVEILADRCHGTDVGGVSQGCK